MAKQIILTALDGALLRSVEDAADELERLKPIVAQLQAKAVAVIVFTERDRAELEPIREQLGLTSPFITESGSGIFTPVNHNPFTPVLGEKEGAYYVQKLGCPYVQARAGLRVLANLISHPLKGFGDFTVPQLERTLKISEDAAHRAKAREFSEPFMTPKAVETAVLKQAAEEMGFALVLRSPEESRFSELAGAEAGLAPAVGQLIAAYQNALPSGETLKVMGLSSREEELAMLAGVSDGMDWTGVKVETAPGAWENAVKPLLA